MDKYYQSAKEAMLDGKIQKAIEQSRASLIQFKNFDSALLLGNIYCKRYVELGLAKEVAVEEARIAFRMGAENGHLKCHRALIKSLRDEEPKNLKEAVIEALKLNEYGDEGLKKWLNEVLKELSFIDAISFLENCLQIVRTKNGREAVQEDISKNIERRVVAFAYKILRNVSSVKELDKGFKIVSKYEIETYFKDVMLEYVKKKATLLIQEKNIVAVNKFLELLKKSNRYKEGKETLNLWLARSYCTGENGVKIDLNKAMDYYSLCSKENVYKEVLELLMELVEISRDEDALRYAKAYGSNLEDKVKKKIEEKEKQLAIRKSLENVIKERGIEKLVHFTARENLESIRKHGILSVQALEENEIEYLNNDKERKDKCLDAISLSITTPNYRLLSNFKEKYPNRQYVLIDIKPSILFDMKIKRHYCDYNAAAYDVAISDENIEIMFKKQVRIINFYGTEICGDREDKEENEPTLVQAEILFFGRIAPEDIIGWKEI